MNAPHPPEPDDPPGRTPSPLPRRGRTTALYAQVPVPDPRTPGDGPDPSGTAAPGPPHPGAGPGSPHPAAPTVPVARPGPPPRTPPMPWPAVARGPVVLPPARPSRVATWWTDARRALSRRTLERRVALGLAVTVVLVASAVVALALVTGPAGADRPAAGDAAGAPAADDVAAGAVVEDPAAYGTDVLTFRSPTGNLDCRIDDGGARCTVANRTWAPPPGTADCPPDGAAVVLTAAGPATVACGAPATTSAPVLSYDRALRHGDVTCVSRRDGVECRDSATGHGFAVARARYRVD